MFWAKYVALCHEKGESPNAVAAKVGVKSSGTVSNWKKGAMPRDGILVALADYFEVSVSYFFTEDEKKPAPEGELDDLTQSILSSLCTLSIERQKEVESYIKYLAAKEM